jgi:hypothetical protein
MQLTKAEDEYYYGGEPESPSPPYDLEGAREKAWGEFLFDEGTSMQHSRREMWQFGFNAGYSFAAERIADAVREERERIAEMFQPFFNSEIPTDTDEDISIINDVYNEYYRRFRTEFADLLKPQKDSQSE